jgi:hypothetical protein
MSKSDEVSDGAIHPMLVTQEKPAFRKTNLMRQIELRFEGRPIEEILVEQINELGSVEAAARALGIAGETLRNDWLPGMGITVETKAVMAESNED